METILLQLDEQTADRIRRLAAVRQVTPEDLIRELVVDADRLGEDGAGNGVEPDAPAGIVKDPFWGLLADEPELADQIVEEAMIARERYPFRAPRE